MNENNKNIKKKIAPCVLNCPAHVNICGYINFIKQKKFDQALELIYENLPLLETIARICPRPCESNCIRRFKDSAINIAKLRIFLAKNKKKLIDKNKIKVSAKIKNNTDKKICIIGGGPAGICSAYFLNKFGYKIYIYDSMPKMGGMLRYGIPEYRLSKKILDREIDFLYRSNINLFNNFFVDKKKFLDIKKNFDAIIISVGAWQSREIKFEGSEFLLDSIKFLRDININQKNIMSLIYKKKIGVIGGGNVAMDVCRSALKFGASSVTNIYRRTKNQMPAQLFEIKKAQSEGVIFKELFIPVKITQNKNNKQKNKILFMQECELCDKNNKIMLKNNFVQEDFDLIISAIGQQTKADFFDGEINPDSSIKVNNYFQTSIPKVFAIGDAIGARLAVNAVSDAKKVSIIINNFLTNNFLLSEKFIEQQNDLDKLKNKTNKLDNKTNKTRYENNFENNFQNDLEDFLIEANRCLNCGGEKNDS